MLKKTWTPAPYQAPPSARIPNGTNVQWNNIFDTQTGEFVQTGTSGISLTGAVSYADNWWRIYFSDTTNSGAYDNVCIGIANGPSLSDIEYSGVGDNIYIFGAQVEEGVISSYISTSGSTATRAADVLSIGASEFSVSGAGAVVVEYDSYPPDITRRLLELGDGTANNRIDIIKANTGNIQYFVNDGGAQQVNSGSSASSSTVQKVGLSFDENDFRGAVDGTLTLDDNTGTLPAYDTLYIGSWFLGTLQINSNIRKVTVYDRPLTDTELQELTA